MCICTRDEFTFRHDIVTNDRVMVDEKVEQQVDRAVGTRLYIYWFVVGEY